MDQKAKHIEYMVQSAHSAYLKYQESGLEAFQPSQKELAKVKQASIEPAGIRLDSQKGEIKQIEENLKTETELKKKISKGKKEHAFQKCSKILKHSSSFSRHQKKCQVQKQNPLPEPFYLIPDELLVELDK